MTRRIRILALAGVLFAGGGWYLFRPEKLFTTRAVAEPAPAGGAVIARGRIEARAHRAQGVAEVIELSEGRRVVRFSHFETSDGPDLQVYLLANPSAERRRDLDSGYVSLGALKGNVGAQNYEIPEGTDLGRYPAVAVWCRRFGVNFATAPLAPVIAVRADK